MNTTPEQKKLLKLMNNKNRVLTRDEAFDFYIENIMRNETTCKLTPNYKYNYKFDDYRISELVSKASCWHKSTIGSLVLKGALKINIKGKTQQKERKK